MRTVGGVFGDDRVTRISNQTMTVTNHGEVEAEQELPAAAHAEVTELAQEVAGLTVPPPAESGYVDDGGTTTIEITLPDAQQRIVLNAGDERPSRSGTCWTASTEPEPNAPRAGPRRRSTSRPGRSRSPLRGPRTPGAAG